MISKDQRVFNHFIVLTWGQEPTDCTSCAVESWTWQVRRMSADIPLVADDSENETNSNKVSNGDVGDKGSLKMIW